MYTRSQYEFGVRSLRRDRRPGAVFGAIRTGGIPESDLIGASGTSSHALESSFGYHTVTGLTAGHALLATGADSFAFGDIGATEQTISGAWGVSAPQITLGGASVQRPLLDFWPATTGMDGGIQFRSSYVSGGTPHNCNFRLWSNPGGPVGDLGSDFYLTADAAPTAGANCFIGSSVGSAINLFVGGQLAVGGVGGRYGFFLQPIDEDDLPTGPHGWWNEDDYKGRIVAIRKTTGGNSVIGTVQIWMSKKKSDLVFSGGVWVARPSDDLYEAYPIVQ